jgi:hypothetical protein
MKNLKLFTLSILIASLASCKLEKYIIGNQAQSKNDNSMYEFNTKQYYNDGKLLSDTVQIKNLLYDAQVVYEDTTGRITIFDSKEKYINYVGGLKQPKSTEDLAKTELVYNPDNGNYSINAQYSESDPRLMIYQFIAYFKSGYDDIMTSYSIGDPQDRNSYSKTRLGFNYTNKSRRSNSNIEASLNLLIAKGMKEVGSSVKFFAYNPTKYKKRLTVLLDYEGSEIVVDLKPKKQWSVTRKLVRFELKPPLKPFTVPITGGHLGRIVAHYSELIN